ncbi:hypothetical protein BGZ88_009832 [Linnemannia elongata]|nr:hypothetical protein BGZ88_009832 [Linnemannia elongata]
MEVTQSFRLIGSKDIEDIPCGHIAGQYVVYWEDIEQVFPGVKHIKNGNVTVTMMRDPNRLRIVPHCIKHYPGVVLDVVLSSAADHVHVDSPMATSSLTSASSQANTSNNPPANALTNAPTNASITNPPAESPTDAPTVALPANPHANPSTNASVDTPANPPADVLVSLPVDTPANPFASAPTNNFFNPLPPTKAHIDTPINPPTNSQSDLYIPGANTDMLLANSPSSLSVKGSKRSSTTALAESVTTLAIASGIPVDHPSTESCQGFQSAIIHRQDALHDQGAMT